MKTAKRVMPLVCGMLALWMLCSCSARERKEDGKREEVHTMTTEKPTDKGETIAAEPTEQPEQAEQAERTEPSEQQEQSEQREQTADMQDPASAAESPDNAGSESPANTGSESPADAEPAAEPSAEAESPAGSGTPANVESGTPAEPEAETPVLLFEDNFDGTVLDAKKWTRCPNWERGGGACVWDDDYAFLDGEGHLVLRAEYDEDYEVVHSGAVWTKGLFECAYGYYEASIRFPTAPGTWGAFWMEIGNLNDPSPTKGLEIDIIESINNESGLCNHNLHWNYPDLHSVGSGQLKKKIYDGEFHTFGLLRTDKEYVFYIDGRRTWKANAKMCEPCPLPGFMELTVEAAEWAGAGSSASIRALPADMLVDYVRVYSAMP